MRIDLQWAMTREDSGFKPCELCEADFEPRSIIVGIDPHGFEICHECVSCLLRREDRDRVRADWPTWEEYERALRDHPEPMMTSGECDRAEELGLYDAFYNLAKLSD